MGKRAWLIVGLLTALSGCQGPSHIDPSLNPPGTEPLPGTLNPTAFLDPRVMAPTPTHAASPVPAITGGTLFITGAGDVAIVSDPDRDRIVVVDLVAGRVTGIADLPPGSEPFRAIEDADLNVHVVLRGTGDVFSFAPANVASGERHHVCAMPRGIAFDAEQDSLVVACRSGSLVTLGTDGAIRSTVQVVQPAVLGGAEESDLRDVVVSSGHTFVSTFRSARLLEVDATGTVLHSSFPDTAPSFGGGFIEDGPRGMGAGGSGGFSPSVAWRTVAVPGSGVPGGAQTIAAVHQRASDTPVEPQPGGYGAGGGSGCGESSIVQSAITFYFPDGSHSDGASLTGATLPVDMAFSRDGTRVTVIAAANESGEQAVQTYDTSSATLGSNAGCMGSTPPTDADGNLITVRNPIAAAYGRAGLLVQQRDPSALVFLGGVFMGRTLNLTMDGSPAETRFDTGHAVFHANSGAFIACASCHPEGGDDGRVWSFDGIGPRRTPALHGDLRGTEPFHWDGDMTDLHVLVHQVFTSRMSGPELSGTQVDTLGDWLDGIPAPIHETGGVDAAAVSRGQQIFYGEAQCGSCHSGALMTNNQTMDVGTSGRFQVPSLIGVSYRTPLMHDGACPTLRARLVDAACSGGERHGHTADLQPGQVDDLIAFIDTL